MYEQVKFPDGRVLIRVNQGERVMDTCSVCGQPEDHVNHEVEEITVYNDGYPRVTNIGHNFEPNNSVD